LLRLLDEEKERIKQSQKELADAITKLNAECGTQIKATYDLNSEPKENIPQSGWAGWGYSICGSIADGVRRTCEFKKTKSVPTSSWNPRLEP
jgi:hypothetical protein